MNVKDIINKIKEFISKKILDFKALSKTKKLALVIASVAVILSIVFGVKYMNNNKYKGLNSTDAASITKELESENIDMKIQGDSILVPKDKVDELRLKLSENISNGSKGYELMDEGSSFGMTDEEFKELLKKRYQVQLSYYKRALMQMTKRPVKEACIYAVSIGQTIFC